MTDGQPITVQLPSLPDQIPRDKMRDICRMLGIDPANVVELRCGVNEITATLFLRDSDGHKIRYGEGPATTIATIPIR